MTTTFARDCSDKKAVAKELLDLELSGRFYSSKSKCIESLQLTNKFEYILFEYDDFSGENDRSPSILVPRNSTKIMEIKPKKDYPGTFIVEFELKGKNKYKPGAKLLNYKSSFSMMTFTKQDSEKSGCASVIEDPKEDFIFEGCL